MNSVDLTRRLSVFQPDDATRPHHERTNILSAVGVCAECGDIIAAIRKCMCSVNEKVMEAF